MTCVCLQENNTNKLRTLKCKQVPVCTETKTIGFYVPLQLSYRYFKISSESILSSTGVSISKTRYLFKHQKLTALCVAELSKMYLLFCKDIYRKSYEQEFDILSVEYQRSQKKNHS